MLCLKYNCAEEDGGRSGICSRTSDATRYCQDRKERLISFGSWGSHD